MSQSSSVRVRERIIEFVARNPSLYNTGHPNYNYKKVVDPLWDEIGQDLNLSGPKSKSLWKNLKDSYRVQKKKLIAAKKRGMKFHPERKWHFYDMMEFVEPFIDCSGFELLDTDDLELGSMFIRDDSIPASELETTSPILENTTPTRATRRKRRRTEESDDPDYTPTSRRVNIKREPQEPSSPDMVLHTPEVITPALSTTLNIPECTTSSGYPGDPETLYGAHVAAMLRSFTPRQRQMAKMRIEQLFYEIQFPEDKTNYHNGSSSTIPTGMFGNSAQYVNEVGSIVPISKETNDSQSTGSDITDSLHNCGN